MTTPEITLEVAVALLRTGSAYIDVAPAPTATYLPSDPRLSTKAKSFNKLD